MNRPASTHAVRNALYFLPRRFQYFGYNYSDEYKAFIHQFIQEDRDHPLWLLRRRAAAQRPKKGLWWHVTTDKTAGPKRVVRSWVRRRLMNAFSTALKDRGVDEHGKLLPAVGKEEKYRRSPVFLEMEKRGEEVSLEGSMRLHAEKSMLTAKYVDFKKEVDAVVDALLMARERALALKMGMPPSTRTFVPPARPMNHIQRSARPNVPERKPREPRTSSQPPSSQATSEAALGWAEMMRGIEEAQGNSIKRGSTARPSSHGVGPRRSAAPTSLRDTKVPNAGKLRTAQSSSRASPLAARSVKAKPPAPKFGTLLAKKGDVK